MILISINDIIDAEFIMLIDIEGTDGSGKAVQTKKLFDYLVNKGYKCRLISFPNYDSPSSEPVKMYLAGEIKSDLDGYQNSALFAVDRLITMNNGIDINDYDFVLFDRYVPSNMIHQSTKMNNYAEIDSFIDWVADFEYGKLKLPKPDKIIFLDNPPKYSIQLARARSELKNKRKKIFWNRMIVTFVLRTNALNILQKNLIGYTLIAWIKV